MIISWFITAIIFLSINLLTAWQLPWITQLILISPFFIFSVFLSFRRQGRALTRHQWIILAVILLMFVAILVGMFSEDHFMIAGAVAALFPVVLIPYLLILFVRQKKSGNDN